MSIKNKVRDILCSGHKEMWILHMKAMACTLVDKELAVYKM